MVPVRHITCGHSVQKSYVPFVCHRETAVCADKQLKGMNKKINGGNENGVFYNSSNRS